MTVDAPVAEECVRALRERLQRSGAALPSPVATVAVGQRRSRSRSRSPRAVAATRSPRSRSRSPRGATRPRSRSRSVSFGSPRSAAYERRGELNETSFVQRAEYSESDSGATPTVLSDYMYFESQLVGTFRLFVDSSCRVVNLTCGRAWNSDDEWDQEWQRESMRRKRGGSFSKSPRSGGRRGSSPVSALLAEAKRRGAGRFQV